MDLDLEFGTGETLLTMQTTFQLKLMKVSPLRENLAGQKNDI